jgi:hypothetical protein
MSEQNLNRKPNLDAVIMFFCLQVIILFRNSEPDLCKLQVAFKPSVSVVPWLDILSVMSCQTWQFCQDATCMEYSVASICYTYTTIFIKIHLFGLEILFQGMGVIDQRLVKFV